jgi:hypothetical protein
VVLAEYGGLTEPNACGHLPLEKRDPACPLEPYFRHADYIVDNAASPGMRTGMLPTSGDQVNKKWGTGTGNFHPGECAHFRRMARPPLQGQADHLDSRRRSSGRNRAAPAHPGAAVPSALARIRLRQRPSVSSGTITRTLPAACDHRDAPGCGGLQPLIVSARCEARRQLQGRNFPAVQAVAFATGVLP